MSHPSPEQLARLVDEPPTAAEAEHLAACAECRTELDALRIEHDALGALPRILPVPTSWETMLHRLEREGVLQPATRYRATPLPRLAAAIVLFVAGGVTGAALARADGMREVAVVGSSDVTSRPSVESAPAALADEPTPGSTPAPPTPAVDEPRAGDVAPTVKMAAQGTRQDAPTVEYADDDLPSLYGVPARSGPDWSQLARTAGNARTTDEAARFVRDTESAYLAAMTRLAELTESGSSDAALRLATLEGIVATTGAALERSPADPVINGYHLAARAQRDALLRTVSTSPARDPWY